MRSSQGAAAAAARAGACALCFAKNKRGKVMSKKACATGKRVCKHIQAWTQAAKTARKLNKVPPLLKKASSPKLLRVG